MKFTCLQEKLSNALQILEKIIGRNTSLPILQNTLIETEKGRIKLSATDLEVGVSTWITAKIDKQGSVTVPARVIASYVSALPEERVTLESSKYDLQISAGKRYKALIKGMNSSEFPIIPKVKDKNSFKLEAKQLRLALAQVVTAAAISETRPEIAGVYIYSSQANQLVLVATDSYRLAEKNLRKVKLSRSNFSFTIPLRTVQELLRVLNDSSEEVKVVTDESQILFYTPDLYVVSRLNEGNFPDYKKIIPAKFSTQAVITREPLLEAVRTASLFATKLSDVKLEFTPSKQIKILARNQTVGGGSTLLPAEVEGKKLTITFNYQYLLDGLKQISKANVLFQCNDFDQPAVIRGVGDAGYFYLAMPIKAPTE